MTPEKDSPTGLDLHPAPPSAMRVRKGVGVAAIIALGFFALTIVYGVYERQHRQLQTSVEAEADQKATPATGASNEFTSRLPAGDVPVLKPDVPLLEDQAKNGAENSLADSSQRLTGGPPGRLHSPTVPSSALPYQNPVERVDDRDREGNLAYQREREAIEAPTGIGGTGRSNGGNASAAYASSAPPLNNLPPQTFNESGTAIQVPRFSSEESKPGFAGMNRAGDYSSQNGQDEKLGFVAQARNRKPQNYLQSVRTKPLSNFEIKAGWDIPATLEQAINSDQPGEIKALVRENVYGTATGKYVLIPQGSRLVGSYNSVVSYGQDGVQAVWDRVIFPDASSLNLNGMIGQDAKGEAGLRHSVDHHYARLVGFAVLTSLFSAAFELSQNRSGTILAVPSPGEIIGGAVGSQVSQLGMEITRRNLNVQPTIKVPAGYRFNVRVNRDIVFEAPCSPLR